MTERDSVYFRNVEKSYQENHLKTKSNLGRWNSHAAYDVTESRQNQAEI